MALIQKLMVAIILSFGLYWALGGWVLDKPISYGSIEPMIRKKVLYGQQAPSPKLIIIAGSNARTSHRCELLERRLNLACVNAGNTAGLGLSYVFNRFEPIIHPGDVVYLPLEYQQYTVTKAEALTGPDAAILFRHDKRTLLGRGPEGVARAAFMVDLAGIVDGLVESALKAAGVSARFDTKVFDRQGDELGLTHEVGRPYDAYIATTPWAPPTAAVFRAAHGGKEEVADFLDACRRRGVRVIGGLPVSFNDKPIPPDLLSEMARFYRDRGAEFLVLPNRSQYPRDVFFDSPFHLEEQAAILHSDTLARALAPLLTAERETAARRRKDAQPNSRPTLAATRS